LWLFAKDEALPGAIDRIHLGTLKQFPLFKTHMISQGLGKRGQRGPITGFNASGKVSQYLVLGQGTRHQNTLSDGQQCRQQFRLLTLKVRFQFRREKRCHTTRYYCCRSVIGVTGNFPTIKGELERNMVLPG